MSSGAAERYDHDFLLRHVAGEGVRIENITTAHGVLVLAGPRARDILAAVTDTDLSNAAFPWLTAQPVAIGVAPATAMRVNFVGELGWELHHPIEYQNRIFDALAQAGEAHGLAMCGMRAMDSLRIEKSYRMWGQDLTIEYSAFEAGLDRFVALDKGDFVGRGALVAQREAGVPQDFVTLEVEADDADPWGNEPIYDGETMIGRATSGAYGHTVGKESRARLRRPRARGAGPASRHRDPGGAAARAHRPKRAPRPIQRAPPRLSGRRASLPAGDSVGDHVRRASSRACQWRAMSMPRQSQTRSCASTWSTKRLSAAKRPGRPTSRLCRPTLIMPGRAAPSS